MTFQISGLASAFPGNGIADRIVRARRSPSLTRAVSLALFAGLALWIVLVYRDYGISNDEPVQHTYGHLLWAWYRSGFADDRVFSYINLYLYGGLFDLMAVGLSHYLPMPPYELRHLLSAGFGLAGLFAVWRLTRLLGSEKAGILAVLLLASTGMYGGAMFTHTKDVPFAAAMVWALYFTTLIAFRLPALPSWRTVLGLGVAVGCAMGLRVGGAFAVFYLLLTVTAGALVLGNWRTLVGLVARLLPAGVVAYAIMAITWPWSVLPPTNLFKAMGAFSNFSFDLKTLVNGQEIPISQVPATYMSEYLLIKLPEATLLGILAALVFAVAGLLRSQGEWRRRIVVFLPLALSLAVPIGFTLLDRPPLYNGIRHFLFVLPPATVVAALGFRTLWLWSLERPVVLRAGFVALAVGLFGFNARNFVQLHPYEYVNYNLLAGGPAGAQGRFEGDYWSASLREAALELREGVENEDEPPKAPYKVAVCAEDMQVQNFLGSRLVIEDDWDKADFLLAATNVGCDNVVPGMTYRTISREGVHLGMVVDLRARHDRLIDPLPWDDDNDPETPAVSFNGPGSLVVARRKP